ncbi:putative porin [Paraflavisolibacter sp. H34]|uniref:putative porin n=1 Tax=Huijunlia imazamoxiresistens TaxID=3127457 RepID=UPI003017A37E
MKTFFHSILFSLALCCCATGTVKAQLGDIMNRMPRGGGGGGGGDSLQRRSQFEDSITITYRYIDSTRSYAFDSSLSDFTQRFPLPATHVYLGNTGSATRSLLFSPMAKAGWDPGFHAFDAYKWKLENLRFYNTTRPYTELGYFLASKSQQLIEILHTQNLKPYWNAAFNYRLINSPGYFANQKTNHNNYLLNSWYQSPNKRYNNYFVFLANSLQAGESGGIRRDQDYLNLPGYEDRFIVPTKIGGVPEPGRDFFSNNISTGNRYKESTVLMRQQYDLGRKDSLVTDTVVVPLFYPRLRFEHTFKFNRYDYHFFDYSNPDSAYYATNYGYIPPADDSISFRDHWREINNDFSIYQFPDAKNLHQFIKVGLETQLLNGTFDSTSDNLYNIIGHGEYRNRSRNQKWDIEAFGRLFLAGSSLGDYHAYVSLQSLLGRKIGTLQLGFENVNRTPPYLYNRNSSFYLDDPTKSFSKENTVHFFGATQIPALKLKLGADYFLMTNYLYLTEFRKLQQERALFNVLRLNASKVMKLGRYWNWYADVWVQQKAGSVQLNIPFVYTRQRLVFEGRFFRNLFLATGAEVRYHTPYKADNYSPVLGQFFFQDAVTINNRPDVAAFMHFRIRTFKAYLRAENLNSLQITDGGPKFNYNNLAAPDYLLPGLMIRFGISWNFIN